ncbi:unnamed protein product [Amoebophrya sp. A120]|nr:unnamed protein product [Amoebophrya sp. A120]|eukprot:GSA120T00019374001.1
MTSSAQQHDQQHNHDPPIIHGPNTTMSHQNQHQQHNNYQNLREVGTDAHWTLSSAKPGNGLQQLRDDKVDTFWQSDGFLPHLIDLKFSKKTKISEIYFYLSFREDESYTPASLSVRIGNSSEDLEEVQAFDLKEPEGWIRLPLVCRRERSRNIAGSISGVTEARLVAGGGGGAAASGSSSSGGGEGIAAASGQAGGGASGSGDIGTSAGASTTTGRGAAAGSSSGDASAGASSANPAVEDQANASNPNYAGGAPPAAAGSAAPAAAPSDANTDYNFLTGEDPAPSSIMDHPQLQSAMVQPRYFSSPTGGTRMVNSANDLLLLNSMGGGHEGGSFAGVDLDEFDEFDDDEEDFVRAFHLQIALLSNHQNGRDTHVRQIKVYGPQQLALGMEKMPRSGGGGLSYANGAAQQHSENAATINPCLKGKTAASLIHGSNSWIAPHTVDMLQYATIR